MANNIEWSLASYGPTLVERGEILKNGELEEGEVGVWLGSDAANILYGSSLEELWKFAQRLTVLVEDAIEERDNA